MIKTTRIKKKVDYQRGENFDYGKHADAESHLFKKKAVVDDGHGSALQAFTEEEPGNDAAHHPEDERIIGLGL
ncbi:hypothetical protein [Geotalea toluenoxydans]|uniref:hypothetical protein n=1 Tax=Geotalea toluenoxydans TaxID=421624 RepID=UPI003F7139AF